MIQVINRYRLRVGEREWFGEYHSESIDTDNLHWESRQFIVRFESKWSVSVIWDYCTYSDNHDLPFYNKQRQFTETPSTVEAGVIHRDREGLQPDGEPFAYIDTEQLNALLTHVSALHTTDHYNTDRTSDAHPLP